MNQQASTKKAAWAVLTAMMAFSALGLTAEESAASEDPFAFFTQEAQVTTASKRAQKKSDSPVAIDVITREEIETSGAQTIWDLLRFRVGIDVIEGNSIEGNSVLLSVRGLAAEFSQSLQVLVDGRSVVSPANSGVFWRAIPVALADIERIEIVRGPNSALFGANAGQGVINIITRKAEGALRMSSVAGKRGEFSNYVEANISDGPIKARASVSNSNKPSSLDPWGQPVIGGNAESENETANLRLSLKPWEGGEVELSGGFKRIRYDVPAVLGIAGGGFKTSDLLAQVRHALSDTDSFEVNVSYKGHDPNSSISGRERVYDGELLYRADFMEGRLQSVAGVSLRHAAVYSPFLFNLGTGNEEQASRENRMARAYAAETIKVTDWATFSLAGSFESSDTGGQWPAYQGALVLKPIDNHTLRLSGSKSPTMPSLMNKWAALQLYDAANSSPPFVYSLLNVRGTDMTPPQVASYEATLSGHYLDNRFSAEVTGFQMEVDGYPDFNFEGTTVVPGLPTFIFTELRYRNAHSYLLRGTETVLTFKPRAGTRLQVNHTYEDVYNSNADISADKITPWNKVNVLAYSELPGGLNASLSWGWQGEHYAYLASRSSLQWIPDQAKLDIRVGYKPWKELELYAVGSNLLAQGRVEAGDGVVVPQTYLLGMNVALGGSKN